MELDEEIIQDEQIQIQDQNTNLSKFKDFSREKLKLPREKALRLMAIDVTSTIKQQDSNQIPLVRIFAVDINGNSYQVLVKGYKPFFFVPKPNISLQRDQLEKLRVELNKLYFEQQEAKHAEKYKQRTPTNPEAITQIKPVNRYNIRQFIPAQKMDKEDLNFLQIFTATPKIIPGLRNFFENERMILEHIKLSNPTFESNIPYALRFMISHNISGMGWFSVDTTSAVEITKKDSICQAEFQCYDSAISDVPQDQDSSMIPPLRILSFDIECECQQGFPSFDKNPIIQIACICKRTSEPEADYRVVFVHKETSPISGVHVKEAVSESGMLEDFQNLLLNYDPDFIIGYNMISFDLKYILERAEHLKIKNYGHFGRTLYSRSWVKKGKLQSKVMGMRETVDINIEGRIQLDLMIHMLNQHKLSSYRLNSVAYHFLKDQKEDVHHTEIYKLHRGSKEDRKRLAIYCLKDAELPLRLFQKLCCLYNYTEMSRVTGVPINYLLTRGQQIKVTSQLLRKTQGTYLLPTHKSVKTGNDIGYEGAFVLDPAAGFYKQPIATLDFASLYPSIMRAYNYCYTTLISDDQIRKYEYVKGEDYETSEEGFNFVTPKVKKGLIPQVLEQIVSARAVAKAELKKATDPMMIGVLEGRQLALKISANSVYGYTGATVGHLPCLEISASVTHQGRTMIEKTRDFVLDSYLGSEVIYGDTDSVMVKFKLESSDDDRQAQRREAMQYGKKAAKQITEKFNRFPIKLQFEKVYCPYLLMSKKRYAGVYWTNPQNYDKIDKKGIESVRRDNCVLIREILETIMDKILLQDDVVGVIQYIKATISDLYQNKIDISKLVISKAITKQTDDKEDTKKAKNTYKVKQGHVMLAEKMKKRDENMVVSIGDRIAYVMIEGQKGSKNYENTQDPIHALKEDKPIDYDYYVAKQLKPPLQRLLKNTGIITNFDSLFTGEHTKNRYIPKINKTSIMGKFIKVHSSCIRCNRKDDSALCEHCLPVRKKIIIEITEQLEKLQVQENYEWKECQKCQGHDFNDILCSNLDCPIFFRRLKGQKDIEYKRGQLARLQELCSE